MKASINGKEYELPDGLTIAQVLRHLEAPQRGIAVARNDCVVGRSSFERELVREGDRLEIIRAVAGG